MSNHCKAVAIVALMAGLVTPARLGGQASGQQSTRTVGSIPRSYLWIVPKGDYIPISGDRAQQFQDVALAFLGGRWENR